MTSDPTATLRALAGWYRERAATVAGGRSVQAEAAALADLVDGLADDAERNCCHHARRHVRWALAVAAVTVELDGPP